MKKHLYRALIPFLYGLCLCTLSLNQLQLTIYPHILSFLPILSLEPVYLLLNLLILAGILLILCVPCRRLSTGGIVFSAATLIATVANLYTVLLHGSLLTLAELKNAGTAFQVLGSYNFFGPDMPRNLIPIFLTFLVELGLSLGLRRFVEDRQPPAGGSRLGSAALRLAAGLAAILVVCSGPFASQKKYVQDYFNKIWGANATGYPMGVLCEALKDDLAVPEGYDEAALDALAMPQAQSDAASQPDIILILNETFYDPALIADIETDVDYMAEFYAIEGGRHGYSVSRAGGGTNNSEFELLTGIPQFLVNGTPFNLLNMEDCSSIVSLLNAQGYYTIGGHCGNRTSYNRHNAYPQLGFDEIHHDEDFRREGYGQRAFATDASDYADMLRWYEQATQTGQPVFAYLLTIQNHGGWNTNAEEYDTVHLQNYTGSYSESEINEYLTGIQMSGQALSDLCDYFRGSDRDVIICMLGDHSPSFYNSITTRSLGASRSISAAATPLFVWANFDLELTDEEIGWRSATSVVPMLLEAAGVRSSPYYQYIHALSQRYPVITGWGEYTDAQGNVASYRERTDETEDLWNYFYLSYNNLLPESREEWFTISSGKD